MIPVQKGSARIYVTSSINFMIAGNFSSGKYRLYFTYSADVANITSRAGAIFKKPEPESVDSSVG
jgi:hypothetical protein